MMSFVIYIIDDEITIREGLQMAMAQTYDVHTFVDAESALSAMPDIKPDLVLLDIGLPGMNGIDALKQLRAACPDLPVIIITAYEEIDIVIDAMKNGAYDFIVKPIQMDRLEIIIRNSLATISLRKEVELLQEKCIREQMPCFVGESDAIQDMMAFIKQVAKSPDTPVLIRGETGTGKELIASAIHYRSPNFNGPFITVNCASIPRDLIESELFGYEKGAFSGAGATGKKGLIEEAEGGTLFLDELGDLSPPAQAKLLRFLENGEFYKVGGTKKHYVKTRVVSATNKDLETMVDQETFRRDLFFRLGVITTQVPSLNDRGEDILPLARYFIAIYNEKFEKKVLGLNAEAEKVLMNHRFTGNVRELKNMVERGVLITEKLELTPKDLGMNGTGKGGPPVMNNGYTAFPDDIPEEGIDIQSILEQVEKYYYTKALDLASGNESKAARLLHLNHHTFRYRRRKMT